MGLSKWDEYWIRGMCWGVSSGHANGMDAADLEKEDSGVLPGVVGWVFMSLKMRKWAG